MSRKLLQIDGSLFLKQKLDLLEFLWNLKNLNKKMKHLRKKTKFLVIVDVIQKMKGRKKMIRDNLQTEILSDQYLIIWCNRDRCRFIDYSSL